VQKLCSGPDNCGRPSIKRALLKLVRGARHSGWQACLQKQMRPGPATRAASYVDFLACFSRCAGRGSRSDSAPREECRFYLSWSQIMIFITALRPLRDQRPDPVPRQDEEEAAMPKQPARAHTRSGMSPADSLSRIVGLPLALPQSSSKFKKLSRFHCRHSAAGRSCPQ